MRFSATNPVLWSVGPASAIALGGAWASHSMWMGGLGAAGLCYVAAHARKRPDSQSATTSSDASSGASPRAPAEAASLVDTMLSQQRYALLLRRQLVGNLRPEQWELARQALEDGMALSPEGNVTLEATDGDGQSGRKQSIWHVAAFFLDRHPVTNRQYRHFVDAGGYEQMSIWEPHVWPAVFDFLDSTGRPGPRFWKSGCYPSGEDDLPVVGVSWHEASAYARWAGKRLPTEAEWVKAGSWPVPLSATSHSQRRFPWGDTMDRERANLWGSGPGKIVNVNQFAEGVSVGGIYQLIGNVWEWTTGEFGASEAEENRLTLPTPMRSIRGGAFDTYFENQATCQFQSGENPLARKHNIGFRCALNLSDVAAPAQATDTQTSDETSAESTRQGARA